MTTKKELKGRWTDDLVSSVLTQLRSGSTPAPFGNTEEGLLDLRGFVISGILRNMTINDADLTYCTTERGGQFLGCSLQNVTLSNSILKTNIDGAFASCKFEASNLNGALFRGRFEDCSFMESKLKNSAGEGVSFRDCKFDGADLRGAHLCSCTFESCTWREVTFGNGSFYRSKFSGDQPDDVGNTIMDRAEFV